MDKDAATKPGDVREFNTEFTVPHSAASVAKWVSLELRTVLQDAERRMERLLLLPAVANRVAP